jgi:RNA polymerase-binding transcription factor DksA
MQDTEIFKKRLESLKTELSERVKKIDIDIRHEGLTKDWSDQAIERENDEVLESLGTAADEELQMINHALQRIEENTFFICSNCGDDIPVARLESLPFTSLCVSCAEDLE